MSQESLLETLDILETDPDILRKLRASEAEMQKGDAVVWRPRARPKRKGTARSKR